MKYGLPEATVESICAVFARHPEVEKAILYGSRAKGKCKPGSDIDLTLCGEGLASDLRSAIASELENEELLDHIGRVGVAFYVRTTHD